MHFAMAEAVVPLLLLGEPAQAALWLCFLYHMARLHGLLVASAVARCQEDIAAPPYVPSLTSKLDTQPCVHCAVHQLAKIAKPDCLAARLSRPQPAKTSQKSALLVLDSSGKIGNVSCMRGGVLCSDLARFTGGCSTLSPKWGAVCHEWSHVEKGFGLKHCQHTWNPRLHLFPGFAKSQAPLLKVLQMGFPCGVI